MTADRPRPAAGAFGGLASTPTMTDVVTGLIGPVEPFRPDRRLTRYASWFITPEHRHLVIAVSPQVAPEDAALAVAHALAWQGKRELLLVLPATAVQQATAMLAYVATPVRVWSLADDLTPAPAQVPSTDAVVDAARNWRLRGEGTHDLGPYESWVADLVESANNHWALADAHRGSYLAWHCAGRQVLKLARVRGGVRIQAGVQYSKPNPGQEPHHHVATGPLTAAQRAEAEAAVAVAVADRLTGRDATHVEHQLQASLNRGGLTELGLVRVAREYPAWRADGAPGYIDFLGLDANGHLHVVETKIGSDPMLVPQALDYLTWVKANAADIRAERAWPAGDDDAVHVDFVVAPKRTRGGQQPAVGPYTAGQLEALRPEVPWRVHIVDDPRAAAPTITSEPARQVPTPRPGVVAEPVTPPRSAGSAR